MKAYPRKNKTLVASEQDPEDVAEKRRQWRAAQSQIPTEKAMFIDETLAQNQHAAAMWSLPQRHATRWKDGLRPLANDDNSWRAAIRWIHRGAHDRWDD